MKYTFADSEAAGTSPLIVSRRYVRFADCDACIGNVRTGNLPNAWFGGIAFGGKSMANITIMILMMIRRSM
jgi:hypothetical protein